MGTFLLFVLLTGLTLAVPPLGIALFICWITFRLWVNGGHWNPPSEEID